MANKWDRYVVSNCDHILLWITYPTSNSFYLYYQRVYPISKFQCFFFNAMGEGMHTIVIILVWRGVVHEGWEPLI